MTYKDLTILKFQQITNAILISEGEPIREAYNVLSVLTDTDVEVYKAMKFKDFQKECKQMDWLSKSALPDKFVKEFECQGETFTMCQHATEWNTEQFISMSTLTKDPKEIINNLHFIMAVMSKGCDTLAEYDRRSKLFQNHLSIEVAYPTGFFFTALLIAVAF